MRKEGEIMTVRDIYEYLNSVAQFKTQEDWDNSGIMAGDFDDEVKKILFALDFTPEVVKEAEELGCTLIVNHHPALFHPAKSFVSGTNGLYEAVRAGISVIASHTCLDMADGGVNDVLCFALELKNIIKLYPESDDAPIMRAGTADRQSIKDFAEFVSKKLKGAVRFTGKRDVEKVALCSGSGCSFLKFAAESGYDTFVTGDASHHDFLDAQMMNINLIAAGHFETENIMMSVLAKKTGDKFKDIETFVSSQKSPVGTVIFNGS